MLTVVFEVRLKHCDFNFNAFQFFDVDLEICKLFREFCDTMAKTRHRMGNLACLLAAIFQLIDETLNEEYVSGEKK